MSAISEWPDAFHLIGAGGIGTHVLLALIELGVSEVHVWDDDVVSAHNRPNQFIYNKSDIGKFKVEGMARFVEAQNFDIELILHTERVSEKTDLAGIVISGVDSLESRKSIWRAVQASDLFISLYIDARLGGEEVHLMTIDPSDPQQVELYMRTLPTAEPKDLSCVTRENPHSALGVAQMVSTNLSLYFKGEPVKGAIYRNLRLEARNPSVATDG